MNFTPHDRSEKITVPLAALLGAVILPALAVAADAPAQATASQAPASLQTEPSGTERATQIRQAGDSRAVTTTLTCFGASLQCFELRSDASSANRRVNNAPLDLRAPDIARVFPMAELQRHLPEPGEQLESQQTVRVEGDRQAPLVPPGIMALPWAVLHPTQAWRIFLPVQGK